MIEAERRYAAELARVSAEAASRRPSVSIAAFMGTQAATPSTMFRSQTKVYQTQVGLSMPLFTNGRAEGRLADVRAEAERARIMYEGVRLDALRDAADALSALRAARGEVRAAGVLQSALQRALELSELRYRAGVTNLLEVLDAQRELFDAEITRAQSRLRERASAVRLYEAIGGNWIAR